MNLEIEFMIKNVQKLKYKIFFRKIFTIIQDSSFENGVHYSYSLTFITIKKIEIFDL
jgi:hypothetical protein